MPIAGVVVWARADQVALVKEKLDAMPGVEVRGATEDDKLVVVLDAQTAGDLQRLTDLVQRIPEVLEVLPAYVNFEDSA
ncbi:MAG: chaperone NapD [Syntrophothermus sp.]